MIFEPRLSLQAAQDTGASAAATLLTISAELELNDHKPRAASGVGWSFSAVSMLALIPAMLMPADVAITIAPSFVCRHKRDFAAHF